MTTPGSWNAEQWLLALNAVEVIAIVVMAILLLWLRSIFATRDDHTELERRVQGHADRLNTGDGRFGRIEDRIGALPTSEAIQRLALSIERLHGDMRQLSAQIGGMAQLHGALEKQVSVMDEFLRQERGRR
jgi:hypothetical protein